MGNLWLKIKIWTKGITITLVLLYLLVFVIKNNRPVPFWWWVNHEDEHSMLLLVLISFAAGAVVTVLLRTTLRTLRQIRELRTRSRTDKLERDLADMKEKASRLQTKPLAINPDVAPPDESIQ